MRDDPINPRERPRPASAAVAAILVLLTSLCSPVAARSERDPLPSWRDGAAKTRTIDFVTEAVTPGRHADLRNRRRGGGEYAETALIRRFVPAERTGDTAARATPDAYDAAIHANKSNGGNSAPQLDDTDITKY